MNLLLAAAGVLALALAGVAVLGMVWPALRDVPQTARLALGYCVGVWLVTMIFFGAYIAGVPFSRWLVMTPVVLLAGVGAWLGGWRRKPVVLDWTMGLPAVLCGLALALAWARPVFGYDAVMMWALKAKMMFFAGTWPDTMFDPRTTAHADYPPLIPSAQAFIGLWVGEFDDRASQVVFAAFFAAGAALLWWCLERRWVWVVWWCAVPITMEQVATSYADLPLAVFLIVFFAAGLAWLRDQQRTDWMVLAGLFGGMSFWVKQDALIGVGAGWLGLAVVTWTRRLPWRPVLIAGLMVVGLAAPWRGMVATMEAMGDFGGRLVDVPLRTSAVAVAGLHVCRVTGPYFVFWPVLLVSVVLGWRKLNDAGYRWLLLVLAAGGTGIVGVYWFATADSFNLLETSLHRVLLVLFVPGLLLAGQLWQDRRVLPVITLGLGLFASVGTVREWRATYLEFGGKTLHQQHVQAVPLPLRRQIAQAVRQYPAGTRVRVVPKASAWHHRFCYETYPHLIEDSTATNQVQLVFR